MTLEFWRNLSVVWIAIHLVLLCLVPLAVAFLAVRTMNWILGRTSDGLQRLQDASGQARARTEEAAAQVTSAVIEGQSKVERVRATFMQLLRRSPSESFSSQDENGSSPRP
ncbi:MAG: hypothetical protein OXF62_20765 [Caldilineaceae bacterium]|nr:hypothetical protein [Caldilineaceae bacterium]MDE0070112.1 hypothetical protein [Caldilineaceae bacterium]